MLRLSSILEMFKAFAVSVADPTGHAAEDEVGRVRRPPR
jgi:hypothetical protein